MKFISLFILFFTALVSSHAIGPHIDANAANGTVNFTASFSAGWNSARIYLNQIGTRFTLSTFYATLNNSTITPNSYIENGVYCLITYGPYHPLITEDFFVTMVATYDTNLQNPTFTAAGILSLASSTETAVTFYHTYITASNVLSTSLGLDDGENFGSLTTISGPETYSTDNSTEAPTISFSSAISNVSSTSETSSSKGDASKLGIGWSLFALFIAFLI